ncbi:MAG: Bifunctional phosphoglucose/phosphomannose isomerase [Microgenomates bacterium 39_7]|nr:MAG: Bifunctional phosphoglucose/phosphomannose isomerase [Microgenomates bacterium 39_7]
MSINTNLINSREEIKKIDQEDVLGSIEALADQIKHAWEETQTLRIQLKHKPTQIVVAGMGGSALGASVVKHLFKDSLPIPLEIVNDYTLPHYVSEETFVILSSYSGNTEEILACAQQAEKLNAQIAVITAGGKLKEIASKQNYPIYLIDPKYNPSGQPRMAIGYAIIGLIGLLTQAKLIKLTDEEIRSAEEAVLTTMHQCTVEVGVDQNPAKSLTFALVDRKPNLIAAEFLTGAAHVASNQFNENAKTFATYYQIPEMNHHLLESLELPKSNRLDNIFLFFTSHLYHQKNQLRMTLTQEAVEKQGCMSLAIKLKNKTKIAQVFELITLSAFTNFYLAVINEINPSKIPMVDWFKDELKKEEAQLH